MSIAIARVPFGGLSPVGFIAVPRIDRAQARDERVAVLRPARSGRHPGDR